MNVYTTTFVAECPVNGDSIVYTLEIQSGETIQVEHIKTLRPRTSIPTT